MGLQQTGDNWLDCIETKGLLCPLLKWNYRNQGQLARIYKAKKNIIGGELPKLGTITLNQGEDETCTGFGYFIHRSIIFGIRNSVLFHEKSEETQMMSQSRLR